MLLQHAHDQTDKPPYALLPGNEYWRQLLIYPSAGATRHGVLLSEEAGGGILWIELNTRKVWGFVVKSGDFLVSFRELARIAQLLESCQPYEFDEVLQRIGMLTGRSTPKAPSPAERKALSRTLVDAWLATLWRQVPDEVQAICLQEVMPCIDAELLAGLQQFHAGLDQEALSASGRALLEDLADINRYDYFIHANPNVQRNRRQAARVFPWLADRFAQISGQQEIYRLQQNLDNGNPLIPVIADHFGADRRAVRFLVGKGFDLIGEEWRGHPEGLLGMAALLKSERRPKTAEDWRLLNRWLKPLLSLARNGLSAERLAEWLDELAREGYAAIPSRLEAQGVSLNDIESIPDLENAVVQWAQAVNSGMDEPQARTALHNYGVLRLAALSRRWHDALARWMEADDESAADESLGWPTLIDKPWSCGDQVVVPLNHAHLLKDEGRRMRHCVGSYASQCLLMGSHIFSIHDGESAESLSTFELKLANDKGIWRVELRQHKALENAEPSAECQHTLRSFLSHLEADEQQKHYADLDWKLRQRQWNSGSYEQLLRNFTWPERVVAEFRELLHGYPLLGALESTPE